MYDYIKKKHPSTLLLFGDKMLEVVKLLRVSISTAMLRNIIPITPNATNLFTKRLENTAEKLLLSFAIFSRPIAIKSRKKTACVTAR